MEYKFKGYDIVGEKGWVYGDLTHNQKVTTTGLEPRTTVAGYEVAPESVGLYTGKHDRNGKEIYVGDIVCFDARITKDLFEVIFANGGMLLSHIEQGSAYLCRIDEYDLEVIGNVYKPKE